MLLLFISPEFNFFIEFLGVNVASLSVLLKSSEVDNIFFSIENIFQRHPWLTNPQLTKAFLKSLVFKGNRIVGHSPEMLISRLSSEVTQVIKQQAFYNQFAATL